MSIGCFTEKKHRPLEEEITQALGARHSDWLALVQFLRERYADTEEWKFMYGKKYGWALHMCSGKKLVSNLYPMQGSFSVQVNLSEAAVQAALQTDLNPHVRQVITAAHPFPEGRWIWIPVETDHDLVDIRALLERRMKMLGLV